MSRLIVPWKGRRQNLLDCLTEGILVYVNEFNGPLVGGYVSTVEQDDQIVGTIVYFPGIKPNHLFLKNAS